MKETVLTKIQMIAQMSKEKILLIHGRKTVRTTAVQTRYKKESGDCQDAEKK